MSSSRKDLEFAVKKNEIKGYQEYARSGGVLEWDGSVEDLVTYAHSRNSERNIRKAFEVLGLSGRERVLDFGAGRCWASYLFSKMGCYSVALDFNTDEVVGLKAGNTLVKRADASFERVAGDCESAPLRDGSFDVVFGFQILHHAYDLDEMVAEAARVLRKGGVLIAVGEHKRGIFQSEERLRKRHGAVAFGVNEHFPTYFAYVNAFKKAGLGNIDVFHTLGWEYLEEKFETAAPLKFTGRFRVYVARCVFKNRIVRKLMLMLFTFGVTIVGKKDQT